MNFKLRRVFLWGLFALGGLFVAIAVWRKISFPYGHREAFLRTVDSDLQNYASDHDGWFPNADDSYNALAKLYPGYSGAGYELAGLSGNIQAVTNALQAGHSISTLTSWVFVPGLRRDDDPRIAILWESTPGLSPDGKLASWGNRPVLLLSLDITNIPEADWKSFLKQQELLRNEVQTKRTAQTNVNGTSPGSGN
jgi:hypothetical protein